MTTKTKTDCKATGLCHYDSATRTNFFHGMLLTDDQLRAEQTYHRDALKRINRYMWGSGIACGLEVTKTVEKGLCIRVHPGFALDCHGNGIEVCECISIDLADVCKKEHQGGCAPKDAPTLTKFLVLKYAEKPADPQPVMTSDDDCASPQSGPKCQPSKYREGFCLELVDDCPEAPICADETEGLDGVVATTWRLLQQRKGDLVYELLAKKAAALKSPRCPACDCGCGCGDCAVGLAELTINCADNDVEVKMSECRQLIWSPRLFRHLVCGLFGNIDKLPPEMTKLEQKLPAAEAIYASPMQSAWDLSAIALGVRTAQLQQEELLKAKAGEKPTAKNKPKE